MATSKKTAPATAWKRLEKAVLQKLGKHAAGRYAAELEPRVMPFASAFDPAIILYNTVLSCFPFLKEF